MKRIALAAALAVAPTGLAAQTPAPVAAASRTTYILAGQLLGRPGQAPRGPSTLVVRDGMIAEVRDGHATPPPGSDVVDLRDRFVMPGLVDMHVHLIGIGGDPRRERLEALNRDRADDLLQGVGNARATLMAGFTTVRDLGGEESAIRALRDAVEAGVVEGPTIVNAGRMISVSGGHGDARNSLSDRFVEQAHHRDLQNLCDGPEECRRAVRRQVGLGARVIKFAATGGVLSNVSGGLGRAMTPDEMRAIVDTAHGLGRKVAAHSHAAEGTKAALEAGVDTIDHGTFLDDEAIRLFRAKGAYLVPTMIAPQTALAQGRAGDIPPATLPKAEAAAAAAIESHRRAFAAGVKVAFGTDTGVSRHGENAREFALMVAAGMTPAQAIRAATVTAAEALGRDDIGTLAVGKAADVIAVSGSPLDDVRRLERVDFVMRRGVVAKRP